ncbi:MFS transporter [Nocardia otitidiscaviarum]|uniref:MFS transporter n=1 Tax=Nocardia otitidiscaviarum TaxID=1823 RepID=UPI0018934B07|nr:MFS transporter [Nocardia otitidiscaviarum]MBF6180803.1 MFS transporter [Nocardia otitidiscaviarum]
MRRWFDRDGPQAWFVPLCAATALLQAGYAAVRVVVSYRALELGGDAATVGVLTALYSLVPLVVAIPIGRAVDSRYAALVLRTGAVVSVFAVAGVGFADGLVVLGAASTLLGFGHILTMVAGQGYITLRSDPADYDRRFGGLTVWISVGQALGIPVVGLLASRGADGIVATANASLVMAVVASLAALICFLPTLGMRPRKVATRANPGERQSARGMLAAPGMRAAMFSSLVILTCMDLANAYLPVLGERSGWAVLTVTAILTARSVAAIVARVLLTRLTALFPRNWLLASGSLCSALPIAAVPLVSDPWIAGALLALAGFFWGLAQPLTMTWVAGLVPADNRASALSLRLTGNRIGQVLIPLAAATVAGSAGPGAVFVLSGGLLTVAAVTTTRALFGR